MRDATTVNKEQQISIRLEPDVAERAETLVTQMTPLAEFKAFRLTRAAVLRMAMLEGLTVLEGRYGGDDETSDADDSARRSPAKRKPKR